MRSPSTHRRAPSRVLTPRDALTPRRTGSAKNGEEGNFAGSARAIDGTSGKKQDTCGHLRFEVASTMYRSLTHPYASANAEPRKTPENRISTRVTDAACDRNHSGSVSTKSCCIDASHKHAHVPH